MNMQLDLMRFLGGLGLVYGNKLCRNEKSRFLGVGYEGIMKVKVRLNFSSLPFFLSSLARSPSTPSHSFFFSQFWKNVFVVSF